MMLVYFDHSNKINMYNADISKEEAQKYITNGCIWIDGLTIEYPPYNPHTQYVEMYLNEDNTIRYEIVDLPNVQKVTTLDDVKKDLESLQKDNLVVMGAQAEQYEGQQSIQKDVLALMSAFVELYEMVIGGSK